jgi:hypothetical protein
MALLAAAIGRRFTAGTLRVNVFGLALQGALSDMAVTSLSGVSLEDSAGFLFLSFAFAMGLHAEGARAPVHGCSARGSCRTSSLPS